MRIKASLVLVLAVLAINGSSSESGKSNHQTVEAFNQKFRENILHTDHLAMLAMWADDGVDLMPGEMPLLGKRAIAAWLKGIEQSEAGVRVSDEELEFHNIQVSGNWASEWANEHQVVERPGKPPIEGYGKIAVVLQLNETGQWSIKQEMWNDSPQR